MDIKSMFELLRIPKRDWFMTGSRALDNKELGYIISTPESDFDFVVSIQHKYRIIAYLRKNNIKIDYPCYYDGFKFKMDNKLYNIINCVPMEFMAWREGLSTLQNFIKVDESYREALRDKQVRYCIYEQLRGLCKSIITFNNKQG